MCTFHNSGKIIKNRFSWCPVYSHVVKQALIKTEEDTGICNTRVKQTDGEKEGGEI